MSRRLSSLGVVLCAVLLGGLAAVWWISPRHAPAPPPAAPPPPLRLVLEPPEPPQVVDLTMQPEAVPGAVIRLGRGYARQCGPVAVAVSATVPLGARLLATGEATAVLGVVSQPLGVALTPGTPMKPLTLPLVAWAWTRQDADDAPLVLAPPDPASPLTRWLALAHEEEATAAVTQAGAWLVVHRPTAEQWSAVLATQSAAAAAAHAAALYRVEPLLRQLDPAWSTLPVLAEVRTARAAVLARLAATTPPAALADALDDPGLAAWIGDPEVEQALLALLLTAPRLDVRRMALGRLADHGLIGTREELVGRMLADPNWYLRYLAALTLLRRDEPAAIPVVAAFAADPELTATANEAVVAVLRRRVAEPPRDDESAFAFWERTAGWPSIAWRPDRLRALRQVVDQARQGASPWIDLLLAPLATTTAPRERAWLLHAASRYHSSRAAFQALAQLAAAPDEDEAMIAVHALAGFTRFPVAATLQPLLRTGSPQLVGAVLTVAVERRFPGYVDLIAEALAHPEPMVRARALTACAEAGLRRLGPRLLQMAEQDPAAAVREAACATLTQLRDARVLPLLARHLAADQPAAVRQSACQHLQRWGTTPAAVQALRSQLGDELLGGRISAHLRRLGLAAAP